MRRKELIYGFLQSLPLLIFAKTDFNGRSRKNCTEFDLSLMEEFASTFDAKYDSRGNSDYFEDHDDGLRPFGSFKTDWTRLKLLQDALPKDSSLKKKFDSLVGLLVAAHQEASQSQPSSGYDKSPGVFTTIPYFIETHDTSTQENVSRDKISESERISISNENDKTELLQTSSTISKFNVPKCNVTRAISSSSTSIPEIIVNSSSSFAEKEARATKKMNDLSTFNDEEVSTVVPNFAPNVKGSSLNETNENIVRGIFDEAMIDEPTEKNTSTPSKELASKTDEESRKSLDVTSPNFTSETPAIVEEEFQRPSIRFDSNKRMINVGIGDTENDSSFPKVSPEQSSTPRENLSSAITMNATGPSQFFIIKPNGTFSTSSRPDVGRTSREYFFTAEEYSSTPSFISDSTASRFSVITDGDSSVKMFSSKAQGDIERSNENFPTKRQKVEETSKMEPFEYSSTATENEENLSTTAETTTGELDDTESSTRLDVVSNETEIQSTSEITHSFSRAVTLNSTEQLSVVTPKVEPNDEMKTTNCTNRVEIAENTDSIYNETNVFADSWEASTASADTKQTEVTDDRKKITTAKDELAKYLSTLGPVDANTPSKLDLDEVSMSAITPAGKSTKNTTEGRKEKPVGEILKSSNSSNSTEAMADEKEELITAKNMKSSYEETPTTVRIEKNALHFDRPKNNQISRDYKHSIEDFGVEKNHSKARQSFAYELNIDANNRSIWRQQLNKQSPSARRLGAFDKDIKPIKPALGRNKNEEASNTTEIFDDITTGNGSKDWPLYGRKNKLRPRKRGTLNRDNEKQLIWFYRQGQTEGRAKSRSKENDAKIKVQCKNRRRH